MKRFCLFVALSVVVVAACAPPAALDSAEIRDLSATWGASYSAGDIDALVALYAEDARLLPPNEAPARGHDAVRAAFGGMMEAGMGLELKSVEAMAAGDVGYHVGNYTVSAGGEAVDQGKFIEAWRKVGGEWKIVADMWSSNAAPAPGGPVAIATHEVKDAARWLAAWQGPESRAEDFKAHGVASVRVFQSPDHPKRVGLLMEMEDMGAFQAWVTSEEGAKAKAADGVVDATLRMMTEVK